jgi:hypothetical protein
MPRQSPVVGFSFVERDDTHRAGAWEQLLRSGVQLRDIGKQPDPFSRFSIDARNTVKRDQARGT